MFQESVQALQTLQTALSQVVRGREDTIRFVLTGLVAGGHVLIEDYPGSGKTTLAKTLGRSIDCSKGHGGAEHIVPFRRIQFTPDLLPSDVLGVNVFEPKSSTFRFQHGPVFANIVLADEINRTGPKVQAAFLECMAERQVTIDNVTYPLDELFFVMGTQNPLDLAGTYPLPIVQLDRFLLKVPMRYVSADTELEILRESSQISHAAEDVKPVVTREQILNARKVAEQVRIHDSILRTIVDIVQGSRVSPVLQYGASTRAALMMKKTIAAYALLQGREYATEDDLKAVAPYVLQHRLRFHPGAGDSQAAFQEFLRPHVEKLVSSSFH